MATDEDGWNTVGKGKKTQPKAAKVVEEKGKKPPPKPKKKQQPKPAPPTQPDQEKKLVIGTIENYNFELNTKHTGYQFKGCTNHGNECYHIAVFQGLLACPGFLNFAKTIPTGDSLPTTLTALKAVLQEFRGAPGSPANIYTLLQSMSRTFKQARAKEQADASEYLIHLLTTLDDELQSILPKPTEAARQEDGWETIGKGSRSRGVEHTTGESSVSPITQLFRGTMASRLASRGAKPSVTLQPFTVLPLDIVDDRFHSVAAFLQDWASPQRVELASGEGTKQMVFSSMPPILIVCLKLWSPTLQQKSTKTIQVTENLAIHPSVTTTRTKIEYSLHAAVCHKGGDVTRGHYTAFIKKGDKWALADDSRVTPIHSIGAACTDPYLLFYCRKTRKLETYTTHPWEQITEGNAHAPPEWKELRKHVSGSLMMKHGEDIVKWLKKLKWYDGPRKTTVTTMELVLDFENTLGVEPITGKKGDLDMIQKKARSFHGLLERIQEGWDTARIQKKVRGKRIFPAESKKNHALRTIGAKKSLGWNRRPVFASEKTKKDLKKLGRKWQEEREDTLRKATQPKKKERPRPQKGERGR